MASTIVLNCEDEHFIYNSDNFIKHAGKGVKNHGIPGRLAAVKKEVLEEGEPHLILVDADKKKFVQLIALENEINSARPEIHAFEFLSYDFGQLNLRDFVTFDLNYIVLLFDSSYMGFI